MKKITWKPSLTLELDKLFFTASIEVGQYRTLEAMIGSGDPEFVNLAKIMINELRTERIKKFKK